jgi:hypothetical protein
MRDKAGARVRPPLLQLHRRGGYTLIQHRYWDDSCSSPKMTVVARGRIQLRNSLVQAGGVQRGGQAHQHNGHPPGQRAPPTSSTSKCRGSVQVSVHELRRLGGYRNADRSVLEGVEAQRGAPGLRQSTGAQRDVQSVVAFVPTHQQPPPGQQPRRAPARGGHLLSGLAQVGLQRTETPQDPVPADPPQALQTSRNGVALGGHPLQQKRREFYSPTSFQVPLLRQTKGENITVQKHQFLVKTSNTLPTNFMTNIKSPPHLIEKPHLPPYIYGEWVSTRCEIRPLDVYLLRHFSFYEDDSTWVGEHKFFSDPFCTYPKFIVTAAGHFSLVGPSEVMTGVSNIDFQIETASLTALDARVITEMRLPGFCGVGQWKVNVPKELATTNGCIYLGIFIPSVRFDVVKVEMDYQGSWLLFLGQADTNNLPTTMSDRPTAFQLPLVKCGEGISFSESLKDKLERSFYYGSGSQRRIGKVMAVLYCLLVFLRFQMTVSR